MDLSMQITGYTMTLTQPPSIPSTPRVPMKSMAMTSMSWEEDRPPKDTFTWLRNNPSDGLEVAIGTTLAQTQTMESIGSTASTMGVAAGFKHYASENQLQTTTTG